ncbi:hypothetical protein K7W42_19405 [Deinococcus sp. HMF7604]|uniref:hypothetical protein n=1 Tax=Deinococcus betulae TaxID=2873312 RepID=UPI001CC9A6DD|nr:hypothetical protein [Deinococcus betulae]MBZ9753009.1 hypothetical protein [Deinococcus betulae]
MEHYPAYTWRGALGESSLVLAFLFSRVPGIHLKRAWPFAQLQAFIGNALGGKGGDGKKTPDWKLFKTPELLPWFAQTEELRAQGQLLSPPHCLLISDALEQGQLREASWVVQLLTSEDNLDRIHAVAEQMRRLETDEPA